MTFARRVWTVVAVSLGALLAGCAAGRRPRAHAPPGAARASRVAAPAPPRLRGLRERWASVMARHRVPGMAVAVVRGDEVVLLEGLGVRDPATGLPVTPDTVFYIASSTKSFVAAVAVALAEDGRLDLDAPVARYLPRFRVADAGLSATLTVRDLLAHRRGLGGGPINFREAYTGEIDDEAFYRLLASARASGAFGYDNLHYTLLGRVLEATTGIGWKDLVAARILAPAGMRRTFTRADAMYAERDLATPVEPEAGAWRASRLRKTERTMHAAGGMASSAADLARWLRVHLNGGVLDGQRVLSEATVAAMRSPQVDVHGAFFEYGRETYGLGFYVGSYAGQRLVHQFGSFPGWRAHVSFMPEPRIGVAVLVNQDRPTTYFADLVACDVYRRLLGLDEAEGARVADRFAAESARAAAALADAEAGAPRESDAAPDLSLEPAAYAGAFVHALFGTLTVRADGPALRASLGDLDVALRPTGRDQFATSLGPDRPAVARFELGPERRVDRVTLTLGRTPFAFERLAPPGSGP